MYARLIVTIRCDVLQRNILQFKENLAQPANQLQVSRTTIWTHFDLVRWGPRTERNSSHQIRIPEPSHAGFALRRHDFVVDGVS